MTGTVARPKNERRSTGISEGNGEGRSGMKRVLQQESTAVICEMSEFVRNRPNLPSLRQSITLRWCRNHSRHRQIEAKCRHGYSSPAQYTSPKRPKSQHQLACQLEACPCVQAVHGQC